MELFDELLDPARIPTGGRRAGGPRGERTHVSPAPGFGLAASIGTLELDAATRGTGELPTTEVDAKPGDAAVEDESAAGATGSLVGLALSLIHAGFALLDDTVPIDGLNESLQAQSIGETHLIRRMAIAAENRLSARATERRVERAVTIGTDYPVTFAAYAAGQLSRVHVEQIIRAHPVIRLDDDTTCGSSCATTAWPTSSSTPTPCP